MDAYWWALLTACIWGIVPLLEKAGLGSASPAAGVIVRSFGVVLGLLAFGWLWAPLPALRAMSLPSVLLLMSGGFMASFVGQLVFYHALRSGAVSQVTPVAGAYPLVSVLLGWLLFKEPLTLTRGLGALFVITGIFLLRK